MRIEFNRLKQRQSRMLVILRSLEAPGKHLYQLPRSEFYRTVAFGAARSKGTLRHWHVPFMRYIVNIKLSIKKADQSFLALRFQWPFRLQVARQIFPFKIKKIIERLNQSSGVRITQISFIIPPVSERYFDKRSNLLRLLMASSVTGSNSKKVRTGRSNVGIQGRTCD